MQSRKPGNGYQLTCACERISVILLAKAKLHEGSLIFLAFIAATVTGIPKHVSQISTPELTSSAPRVSFRHTFKTSTCLSMGLFSNPKLHNEYSALWPESVTTQLGLCTTSTTIVFYGGEICVAVQHSKSGYTSTPLLGKA